VSLSLQEVGGRHLRVRVGRYRVIYKIFDSEKLVLIGKVARRSEDIYSDIEEMF